MTKRPTTIRPGDLAIARWVRDELSRTGRSQKALAAFLGVQEAEISNLVKEKGRRLTADEYVRTKEFFGALDAEHLTTSAPPLRGVRVMGRISMGYWSKPDTIDERAITAPVLDERYPVERQIAYKVEQASKDGKLQPGDYVLAVPFDEFRVKPIVGDRVVVRRERPDGLYSLTIKRAVSRGGTVQLDPLFDIAPSHSDEHEYNVGLAIGRHSQDF